MNLFESLSKTVSDYIVRWNTFFWFALTAFILYIGGLGPEQISRFLFVLFVARLLALDVATKVYQKTYFSHRSAKISVANPRIWTIHVDVSKAFMEKTCNPTSQEITDRIVTEVFLKRFVIEEFPDRLRCHYWLTDDQEYKSPHSTYDEWIDIAVGDNNGNGLLWPFASYNIAGSWTKFFLSGSWEWDSMKRRLFFQIALRIDRDKERRFDSSDVIFTIPLEPSLLADRTGELVLDDMGIRRKALEVEPYPWNKHGWSDKLKLNGEQCWSWSVNMQAFGRE